MTIALIIILGAAAAVAFMFADCKEYERGEL
jgi:hypothetical protein